MLAFSMILNTSAQQTQVLKGLLAQEAFEEYVYTILALEKDSGIPFNLPHKYKMVYQTNCRFTEVLGVGTKNGAIYSTHGSSLIQDTTALEKPKETPPFFFIHKKSRACLCVPIIRINLLEKNTIVFPKTVRL